LEKTNVPDKPARTGKSQCTRTWAEEIPKVSKWYVEAYTWTMTLKTSNIKATQMDGFKASSLKTSKCHNDGTEPTD